MKIQTGKQVVSYTYDSWGVPTVSGELKDTVGEKNPYRYRGYRYDSETGLYYLNSRYYNPEIGRFISADALAGKTGDLLSHNVFVYCNNNPVNNSDENGYWPSFIRNAWNSVKAPVSSVITTVKNAVCSAYNWVRNTVSSGYNTVRSYVSQTRNRARNTWNRVQSRYRSTVNRYRQQAYNYGRTAVRQLILDRYVPERNLLGYVLQLSTGFIGIDLPADLRDIHYDVTHFEATGEWWGTFGLNCMGLLPGIGSIKNANRVLKGVSAGSEELKSFIKVTEGAGNSVEKVLASVKTYEQARNKALEIIGDLGSNSKPYIGRLESSSANGKIVGRISSDGKVRWRLDYDPNKGIHINVEDFRNGKGANAIKIAIPFEGDEKLFNSLLKHLNE